jgi:hypothetical protein
MGRVKRWMDEMQDLAEAEAAGDTPVKGESDQGTEESLVPLDELVRRAIHVNFSNGQSRIYPSDPYINSLDKDSFVLSFEYDEQGDLTIFHTELISDGKSYKARPRSIHSSFTRANVKSVVVDGVVSEPPSPIEGSVYITIEIDEDKPEIMTFTIENTDTEGIFGPLEIEFSCLGEAWAWIDQLFDLSILANEIDELTLGDSLTLVGDYLPRLPYEELHKFAILDVREADSDVWQDEEAYEYKKVRTSLFVKENPIFEDGYDTETLVADTDGTFISCENDGNFPNQPKVLLFYYGKYGYLHRINRLWLHVHPQYISNMNIEKLDRNRITDFIHLIDDKAAIFADAQAISIPFA